jgi:hypothetical protein
MTATKPLYWVGEQELAAQLWDSAGNVRVETLRLYRGAVPQDAEEDFIADLCDLIDEMSAAGASREAIAREVLKEVWGGGNVAVPAHDAPIGASAAFPPDPRVGQPLPVIRQRKKVLLVASGGGHWVQLMRIAPAFEEHECVYVTTIKGHEAEVGGAHVYHVEDATRWNRFGLLKLSLRIMLIVLREDPDVVVSTGAAPGYFALRFGKLARAKTIWLDSVANIDQLSLSGQMAGAYADLWLTQWSHLARPEGPLFAGSVFGELSDAAPTPNVATARAQALDQIVQPVEKAVRKRRKLLRVKQAARFVVNYASMWRHFDRVAEATF